MWRSMLMMASGRASCGGAPERGTLPTQGCRRTWGWPGLLQAIAPSSIDCPSTCKARRMLAQQPNDVPAWAVPLLYLLIFFVLLPLKARMPIRQWLNEIQSWSPATHALLWGFFFFICVLSCMGAFS